MLKTGILFLLSLVVLQQRALGQALGVNCIVYKNGTQEGLPFASVGLKGSTRGTTADAKGFFTIQATKSDTLVVAAIGHKTKILPVATLSRAIYLEEIPIDLAEVAVQPNGRLKSAKVGNASSKTRLSLGGANQYAMLLQPKVGPDALLEEVYYELQPDIRKNDRWKTAVRIRAYANTGGKPGTDLLATNLVVAVAENEKRLKVDVSKYLISVPQEGIFIGLDFIGFFDERGTFVPYSRQNRPLNIRLPFSESHPSYPTYSRFFGTEWKLVQHRTQQGAVAGVSARFSGKVSYSQ